MRLALVFVICSLTCCLYLGCICPGGYYDPPTGLVYNRGFHSANHCVRSPFRRNRHQAQQVPMCQQGQWPTACQPCPCCGETPPTASTPPVSGMTSYPYETVGGQPGCCGSPVVSTEPNCASCGTPMPTTQPSCTACGDPMPTTNWGCDDCGPVETGCSSCGSGFENSASDVLGNGVPTQPVPSTDGSTTTGSTGPTPNAEQIPAPPAETSFLMVPSNGTYYE